MSDEEFEPVMASDEEFQLSLVTAKGEKNFPKKSGKRKSLLNDEDEDLDEKASSAKKPRGAKSMEKRFSAFPSTQLAAVLCSLVALGHVTEAQIVSLLPGVDASSIKREVEQANKKMWKSFPNARWGSNDDAFAFKRVKPSLNAFNKKAKEAIQNLATAKDWAGILEFNDWFKETCTFPETGLFANCGAPVLKMLASKVEMARKQLAKK